MNSLLNIRSLSIPVGLTAIGLYLARQYFLGGHVPRSVLDGADLTQCDVIVTGGCGGIGAKTCQVLAACGARSLIMTYRNAAAIDSALEARNTVVEYALKHAKPSLRLTREEVERRVELMHLDLADLNSVKRFVQELRSRPDFSIGLLINNAGIMQTPHRVTKQGIEIQFGTNHIGHFLLTKLLLDDIKRNNARVIALSSRAAMRDNSFTIGDMNKDILSDCKHLDPSTLYCRSKLANMMFAMSLQEQFDKDETTSARAYAVHPGVIHTNLFKDTNSILQYVLMPIANYMLLKTPMAGAQTTLFCALAPDARGGQYYADCAVTAPNPLALDTELRERLWQISEDLVKDYV